jgi:DNA-binding winged helix-turn-helix (wHTH) protein
MGDHEKKMANPEDVLIEALLEARRRSAGAIYEFGSFRLEVGEGRLLKDGAPVPLAPREFDTLRLLVERHGRLVTKEELLERVWGGTFVGNETIAQRISQVRKALAADCIETVPKRGYRFVADVVER